MAACFSLSKDIDFNECVGPYLNLKLTEEIFEDTLMYLLQCFKS